jgi:hypothetical protein
MRSRPVHCISEQHCGTFVFNKCYIVSMLDDSTHKQYDESRMYLLNQCRTGDGVLHANWLFIKAVGCIWLIRVSQHRDEHPSAMSTPCIAALSRSGRFMTCWFTMQMWDKRQQFIFGLFLIDTLQESMTDRIRKYLETLTTINKSAFEESGLISIHIPISVETMNSVFSNSSHMYPQPFNQFQNCTELINQHCHGVVGEQCWFPHLLKCSMKLLHWNEIHNCTAWTH